MNIEDSPHTPKIELVSFVDELVMFRSRRHLQPSDRVRFEVEGNPVKVRIRETRAESDGRELYLAEVLEGRESLLAHLGGDLPHYTKKRRTERVLHKMRIISQHLPDFQALSLDFSPLGLKIELEGFVERGSVVPLLIDFDWPGQDPIEASAKVIWCEEASDHYLAGLELIDVPESTRELLMAFYSEIVSGEVGDVSKALAHHRSVAAVEPAPVEQNLPQRDVLVISGHIDGYAVEGDCLKLTVSNENGRADWKFSQLCFLRDHRALSGVDVAEAWEVFDTEELRAANRHRRIPLLKPADPIRHIQFLSWSKLIILEVVAEFTEPLLRKEA